MALRNEIADDVVGDAGTGSGNQLSRRVPLSSNTTPSALFDVSSPTSLAAVRGGEGFSLTLPLPTSANRMWRKVPGTGKPYLSKEYALWKRNAELLLKSAGIAPLTGGKYAFLVAISDKEKGDVDNRIKATGDLLAKQGFTPDDKHAWASAAVRDASIPSGLCRVYVKSISIDERAAMTRAMVAAFLVSAAPAAVLGGAVAWGASGGRTSLLHVGSANAA